MTTARLVYDGDCGFCTATADWVQQRSDVTVVPWQSLDLAAEGLTVDEVTTAAYWLEGGTRARGARAAAAALKTCGPAYAVLGWLIDLPPVRPLARVGYFLVAKYRYKLPGSTDACRLP